MLSVTLRLDRLGGVSIIDRHAGITPSGGGTIVGVTSASNSKLAASTKSPSSVFASNSDSKDSNFGESKASAKKAPQRWGVSR